MKKNYIVLIITFLAFSLALSACHTTEPPCPVYADYQETQPEKE
jgi:hypothetical protein